MRYSQLTTYLTCPEKYKLQYIDKLEPKEKYLDLEFGTTIHKAIECAFEDLDPVEVFTNEWEKLQGVEMARRKYTYWQYSDMGIAFMQNFKSRHLKHYVKLHTEMAFEFEYNSVKFTGTIDGVFDYKGALSVVDWKTSERIYKNTKIQSNLQLYIYAYATYLKLGKIPENIMYPVFVKNESPRIQTLIEKINLDKIKKHLDNACKISELALSGVTFKNFNSCEHCEFTEACWK